MPGTHETNDCAYLCTRWAVMEASLRGLDLARLYYILIPFEHSPLTYLLDPFLCPACKTILLVVDRLGVWLCLESKA